MTRFGAWCRQPASYKLASILRRAMRVWTRAVPWCPLVFPTMPGLWWIAGNDAISEQLITGFEVNERRFLRRFLSVGMTVVDVGANAGLYSMLASKSVGASGRVVSFEPSPRERARLESHLRLNRCRNVTVEPVALGDAAGEAELFVVDGHETGCNSIHPADGISGHRLRVPVRRLDDYLAGGGFARVDFVKMDIEGGELSALRGAESMFQSARPVLLCEIEEARVAPWHYRGRAIIDLMLGWRYQWFVVDEHGALGPLPPEQDEFNGNYVAVPQEQVAGIERSFAKGGAIPGSWPMPPRFSADDVADMAIVPEDSGMEARWHNATHEA